MLSSIAVAGNPNCGKTTLFNGLTGLRYKVANYPGVTVESKTGSITLPSGEKSELIDLPGIYSLSGRSIDELIACGHLLGLPLPSSSIRNHQILHAPHCLVSVVDSCNLERNLYLVTQLIDLGLPLCLALNMGDLAAERGILIHKEILIRELDVPVISIVAKEGEGFSDLLEILERILGRPVASKKRFAWCASHREFLEIAESLGNAFLETQKIKNNHHAILLGCQLLSDSIPTPNSLHELIADKRKKIEALGLDPFSFEATARYQWINEITRRTVAHTRTEAVTRLQRFGNRLDKILTHRFWGSLIFVFVMAMVFQSIFTWAQPAMTAIELGFAKLGSALTTILPDGVLRSLLVDGVLAGVGNVVIFIPQIMLLFFFLALLEDSGYLSRAAFLMDRIMRPFGLQGRSFIPLLSSFACAIPGILSCRTIPSWADRMATIMVAPLMSCSARLPVFAVLIAAFIPPLSLGGLVSLQGAVLLGMYLLGILGAAFVAWALKLSVLKGNPALFVMEMPPLRRPSFRIALREVFDRVLTFLRSAGTTILACSIVLWALASYPTPPPGVTSGRVQYSFAGKIGKAMEPVLEPVGLTWEVGVGILASFAAREVFVSSLATVYNLDNSDDDHASLIETLKVKRQVGAFSTASALSLMVFFVFACQCMSTLAVTRRETGSLGWTAFMFAYMTILASGSALFTYHVAKAFL